MSFPVIPFNKRNEKCRCNLGPIFITFIKMVSIKHLRLASFHSICTGTPTINIFSKKVNAKKETIFVSHTKNMLLTRQFAQEHCIVPASPYLNRQCVVVICDLLLLLFLRSYPVMMAITIKYEFM